MSPRVRQPLVVLGLMALSACSSPTAPPPPPPTPGAPTLSCPASVSLVSPDGARVPYLFPIPTPVNGQPPVTVSCSGVLAAGYPAGSTIVSCTATDALSRRASCNFSVTVTITPKISKTRYLAFGDSITNGRCGPKPGMCDPYTVRLEELLRARYTAQNFFVVASGVNGETTTEGEARLPSELQAYSPEVLLLMEGTNDLTGNTSASKTIGSLDQMIVDARAYGAVVFLASVPPIAPGGPNNAVIPKVVPLNAQIQELAAHRGVQFVDVYAALAADIPRYYVAGDDLHPTQEGLWLIGETFYASIRATLDITPIGTSPSFMRSGFTDVLQPPRRPGPIKKLPGR